MITSHVLHAFGDELKVAGITDRVRNAARAARGGATASAEEIGDALGRGMSSHAHGVGESMGRGMGKHFSDAGRQAVEGATEGAKKLLKSNKVRAGLAGAGALYTGSKVYEAKKQRDRDRTQQEIAASLKRLSGPRVIRIVKRPEGKR